MTSGIEIAVIGIDGVLATAVGEAVEVCIRIFETVDAAGGKRGVEAAGEAVPVEGDRVGAQKG